MLRSTFADEVLAPLRVRYPTLQTDKTQLQIDLCHFANPQATGPFESWRSLQDPLRAPQHLNGYVEDLNVTGMGRRSRAKSGFNGAVHDAALAEFRRQLTYKCSWYSSTLWVASRWYPSSKLCSRWRTKNGDLRRSARVFRCDACGLVIDRDLNAAKNLAALAELACVCLMAQLTTGQPVDWSKLPVRPAGWELDHSTRSSRGCARAGGRKADGGERKTAQRSSAGDDSFDWEAAVATGSVARLDGASPSPKKAVA